MAVKVGDKYLCNIPEAVSRLIEDVEALKDQTAGTEANVYKLILGQAFDEDLFNKMKTGDIVIVDNLPFIILKVELPNKLILGEHSSITSSPVQIGLVINIQWKEGGILERTITQKMVKDLNFAGAEIKAKSLETTDGIIGKTVEQNEANKSFNVDTSALSSGLEVLDNSYLKANVINGVLWIIIECSIKNNNETSTAVGSFLISVDEDTGSKIFKRDGVSINDYVAGGSTEVANGPVYLNGGTSSVLLTCYLKNRMGFYIGSPVAAGSTTKISGRIPLMLL